MRYVAGRGYISEHEWIRSMYLGMTADDLREMQKSLIVRIGLHEKDIQFTESLLKVARQCKAARN